MRSQDTVQACRSKERYPLLQRFHTRPIYYPAQLEHLICLVLETPLRSFNP